MISAAVSLRWSRAFRLISIRPLFSVMLVPSTPMNDVRLSTFGSFRISAASCCWRSAIAPYEIDCGACVIAWITPVSCDGKKPFGISTYSRPVSTSVSTATTSVERSRFSTHSSATA